MTRRHSIAEARSNLPRLVREAESGKAVELTRRGEAVAVLVGRTDYERLTSGARRFSDTYRAFRRRFDLAALAIDPGETFGAARESAAGREIRL